MSLTRQSNFEPDQAIAPVVGSVEQWTPASQCEMHSHKRDQLMYSSKGAMHVVTPIGRWILPPTRAIWISGGTNHAFEAKHPVDLIILYIDPKALGSPRWDGCSVVNVSPLVRELVLTCASLPWDHRQNSRAGRLARVLLEQLDALPEAPLDLPEPKDIRAVRLTQWLKEHPADRTPLTTLAPKFGGSVRTLERLFTTETNMSFGVWRIRLRMMAALELLANGESVANVAFSVGYESASSFISAFRNAFGTTPSRYFDIQKMTHEVDEAAPRTRRS